ncbi:MAG: hypothetical protein KGJ90_06305 [Patescibacteria group bacterium]|nr:hypothetical protein [Patescibacteria group bacterium]
MRTTDVLKDKDFIDWFSHYFGYGYGDGELHIIPRLKSFLSDCPSDGTYDYRELEQLLTPTVMWLLMNTLCQSDVIGYGTSPRFGWLEPKGVLLKNYMLSKTNEELYSLVMVDSDYIHCAPTYCNCGPNGFEEGRKCDNPLFL